MTNETEALLRDALALSDQDRADVAAELLASLDSPVAEDPAVVGDLWSQELTRRARRISSGQVAEDWSVVRQRLADDLAELNDRIWGAGNWVECPRCPDSFGEPSCHHKDFHTADGRVLCDRPLWISAQLTYRLTCDVHGVIAMHLSLAQAEDHRCCHVPRQ